MFSALLLLSARGRWPHLKALYSWAGLQDLLPCLHGGLSEAEWAYPGCQSSLSLGPSPSSFIPNTKECVLYPRGASSPCLGGRGPPPHARGAASFPPGTARWWVTAGPRFHPMFVFPKTSVSPLPSALFFFFIPSSLFSYYPQLEWFILRIY